MDARLMGILTSHARPRPQSALVGGCQGHAKTKLWGQLPESTHYSH